MKKKYKVVLIGTGRVAEHYLILQKLGKTDFLEYTHCFDIDTIKMEEFAKRHGITKVPSFEMLISEKFDFAIVATPSGTHFDIALKLLEANKNVLLEKPACLRIEQVEYLEKVSKARKLMCKSIFQNRFNRAVRVAHGILKSGDVGRVTSFSLRLIWSRYQDYYDDSWHGTWELDGGVTSQQAIHHIDCVNYLIGIPNKVHAYSQNSLNILEAEDTLVAIVEVSPMILGTFHFTTAARPSDMEASLLINGTKSSIRISGIALNVLETFNTETGKWETAISEEIQTGYGFGHIDVFKDFLSSDESNIFPSMRDSLAAVMVVDSLYESIEVSREVLVTRRESKSKLGVAPK